ncbi:hypothetical protein JCGZ_09778 [Jatropha curcas]|uniref:Transmembrane protein n=1 Tax=Jatropha curcas TaxID=180498 RepID=A0A067KMZ3_JATCU|nr:uncharacterized protein At5g23160 [Jatropha curcas]KDP36363.1 hypothetical protein JCGZ_09778 [Jatropha curcas]
MPLSLLSLSLMDEQNQEETHQSKPRTTLFLSCFGFSGKIEVSEKKSSKFHKPWFSRSTILRKKPGAKTVPVDSTDSEKVIHSKKTTYCKSKLKRNSDQITPKRQNPAVNDKNPGRKQQPKEKIILEHGKHMDHAMDSVASPKNLSFRRKIDAIRTGSSQPGSLEDKPQSHATVDRSISLPSATHRVEKSRVGPKKPRKEKFDPVIGMSIVMVTLIIMLLWGRMCAILCTCAWLYFVPRLRTQDEIGKNGAVAVKPDFSSEEHKKRVVMEGFLDRNHRSLL